MRSLLLSKFVPWPPNSGEKRRTLAIARALLAEGDVTICGFVGPNEEIDGLIAEGFDVRAVPLARSMGKTIPGLLKGRSLSAARFWDPALAAVVADAASKPYDALVVVHAQFQMYTRGLDAPLRVLDMQNIESSLSSRMSAARSGAWKALYAADAKALKAIERKTTETADAVLVVSEADRAGLAEISGHPRILVVPNAWDATEVLPAAEKPIVSFVALLSWGPNVDAAVWLGTKVWPLVVEAVPDAHLQLVGRDPSPEVQELASSSIEVTGTVDELAPWYRKTLVCVAPLLAGGGSRLKILEALAAGRPVVATSIGVEGLEDLIGRGVVTGDDPRAMADAVIAMLRDPEATVQLGVRGAEAVESSHSWSAAVKPLLELLGNKNTVSEGRA